MSSEQQDQDKGLPSSPAAIDYDEDEASRMMDASSADKEAPNAQMTSTQHQRDPSFGADTPFSETYDRTPDAQIHHDPPGGVAKTLVGGRARLTKRSPTKAKLMDEDEEMYDYENQAHHTQAEVSGHQGEHSSQDVDDEGQHEEATARGSVPAHDHRMDEQEEEAEEEVEEPKAFDPTAPVSTSLPR